MQAEIIVTNILQTKTAFGMTKDRSESVFIPGKVAEAANIRIGQSVQAMLIPNPNMPEKTPWMAVFINGSTEADTLAEQIKADRIEELAAHAETMAQIVEAYREHAKRLEAAMRKAILLAEQPHYGDRGDALDHCFDGIDVLRDALKGTEHE